MNILFLPRKTSGKPALLIELKWNKSAKGAVTQMQNKDYSQFARKLGYEQKLLLVGINYSTKTGKHTCKIKQFRE